MKNKYQSEIDFDARKEQVKEYINKKIKSSNSDIILGMILFIPSFCCIILSWFNVWTVLLSFLLIFCIWAICSGFTNGIKYKKYLNNIDDIFILEEIEREMENLKNTNLSPEEKIQHKVNNNKDNCENVSREKYSVILTSAYGNCIIEVTKYLKERFSLSLYEASELLKKCPVVIIESTNFDSAMLIKEKLVSLGAGCVVEKFNPNRTNTELKDKYTDDLLHCPRCGSTSVAIGERGWKITTGFIGSSKTTNRCGKCGYSWQPK